MSTISEEQLQLIVSKAARDAEFRNQLKSAPQDAVRAVIKLDGDDLKLLETLAKDLERIARVKLEPVDANSWAMGICHIRTHPPASRK